MPFAFIDVETTGLDRFTDELWEIGLVIDHTGDDPVVFEQQFHIEPSAAAIRNMSPKAREVNGWNERTHDVEWVWNDPHSVARDLHDVLDGVTLVAANPDFDCDFLRGFFRMHLPEWDPEPWHHRKLDIESMFFQFEWQGLWPPKDPALRPEGMRGIRGYYEIPEPTPHTALQDARDVREIFTRLMAERRNPAWQPLDQ